MSTAVPANSTMLRLALRGNAAFSTISGAITIVAAAPLADVLGVDYAWVLVILGAGLLFFAAALWSSAAQPVVNRARAKVAVGLDLGWVAAGAALIGLGLLTAPGAAIVSAVAHVVLLFAVLQVFGLSKSAP